MESYPRPRSEGKKTLKHGIKVEMYRGNNHTLLKTRRVSSVPEYPFGDYLECSVQTGEIPSTANTDQFHVVAPFPETDPFNSYRFKGRIHATKSGIDIQGYNIEEEVYQTVFSLTYEELERRNGYPVIFDDYDKETQESTERLATVRPDLRTFTPDEAARLRLARIPR